MRDNLYRLWLAILLLAVALILGENIARSEEPAATLVVTPKTCLAPCTVKLELHIPLHENNRMWSIAYNDGDSIGEIKGDATVYPECTVANVRPCTRILYNAELYAFVGCVHRLVNDRIYPICSSQTVEVRDGQRR